MCGMAVQFMSVCTARAQCTDRHAPSFLKIWTKALCVAGCAALRSFSRPPLCLSQNSPVLFRLTLLYFRHILLGLSCLRKDFMTRTVRPMMLTKSTERRQRRPSVYALPWTSDVFVVKVIGKLEIGILAVFFPAKKKSSPLSANTVRISGQK